jgi:hypothetical protein
MNKREKNFSKGILIVLFLIFFFRQGYNWWGKAGDEKPIGPFSSSSSIKESKKQSVWLGTYLSDAKTYHSADKSDSFELAEIWMEKNKNSVKDYPSESDYKYILSMSFARLTKENLHKFRVLPYRPMEFAEFADKHARVRFLANELKDTIRIEVIERNPRDQKVWATEKSIDTITLIRK